MFLAAAFALIATSSLRAQAAVPPVDYSTATPLAGSWFYSPAADGSEAIYLNTSAQPQFVIHCTRATRRVSIARPASAAAPFLFLWTSSEARNLPASYKPATARLVAEVPAFDPLLDAIAFSRGRFAIGVLGAPAAVLPSWPEPARVVEDCRG
jgi:hypothetical protein